MRQVITKQATADKSTAKQGLATKALAIRAFAVALATLPLSGAFSGALAKPTVEVAFVLDTTGSMGGLIEGAKRKIWSIASAIVDSNPGADIRMGLVAYRDIGDDYVTRTFDLTTDIQDLYANLLELRARGGGDWPESVNEALDVAVNKLHWTLAADTRRIIFLVGDAPPHMDYAQDTKYPVTLAVAKQKDIIVNAVLAGNARDTERVWRDIAQNGNGRFIPIPQDGGQVVIIETPYDDDIIILQKEINGTVIPYGPRALQKRTEDRTRQLSQVAAAAPAQASEMASYLNKRAKVTSEAVTGDGDLVSDVAAGRQKLAAVKDEELPENIRALKPEQRVDELNKQMKQRNALNEKLAGLVAKRDKFVAEQRDKAPQKASSFDRVVEDTLKAQIKR
jgi:von Willebrand factor type A domain